MEVGKKNNLCKEESEGQREKRGREIEKEVIEFYISVLFPDEI
jgi:hypothetical protein